MVIEYSKKTKIILWALQIVSAVILLQTLYFKFTGAEESIQIFTAIGTEPWGRYLTGTVELISGILLLSNKFSIIGALLAVVLMIGAIYFHMTILGINDLFYLALTVLISSIIIIVIRRKEFKRN